MARVSNAPFREAFLRQRIPLKTLAAYAGMDDTACGRALGVSPLKDKRRGETYYNARMEERTALKIMHALNLDPVDVGL